MIYTIYNAYKTSISDTGFYEKDTNQIELTIILKINETEILVVQAKNS